MADSVKTGKIGSGQGEWLRKDPLIDNYSAIAEEMNPITWEVDFIWDTRRQEMQLNLIGRESECHGQRYRRPMDDRLLCF